MKKVLSNEIVKKAFVNSRLLTCNDMEVLYNQGLNEKDIKKISNYLISNRVQYDLKMRILEIEKSMETTTNETILETYKSHIEFLKKSLTKKVGDK